MSGANTECAPAPFFSYSTVVDGAQGCASLVRGMVTGFQDGSGLLMALPSVNNMYAGSFKYQITRKIQHYYYYKIITKLYLCAFNSICSRVVCPF